MYRNMFKIKKNTAAIQLNFQFLFHKGMNKMNSSLKWIIGIVVLTNLLTFAITKFYFPTSINNNYYLLKMKGQGKDWDISDYQFAWISGKGAIQGSETITYLGEPNELTGRIVVEIYDYFKDGTVPHQIYRTNAEKLENASFKTGGGGAYPESKLSVEDIVNKTFFIIRWTTKDGELHEETIKMELDYSPPILDHIYN